MTDASSSERTPEEQAEIDAFKAKLQSLTFGRVPGGAREGRYVYRPTRDPSWERGIAGEHRPDGSFMPYVDHNLVPMSVKKFADHRGSFEQQVTDARHGVDPFKE